MFDVKNTVKFLMKGAAEGTVQETIVEKVQEVAKENRPLNIKFGLDPSAPDIHLGHAVSLRKIRQLQDLGHNAIIIIGDFTGMIGDPTGKSKTRNQLTREEVDENAKTYLAQIFKIINKSKAIVHMNSEWLNKMNLREVIELSAKMTVARMLERDDFKNRFDEHLPISVHEFFYPLMQAYDSVMVKADIEFGGTDQMFNVLLGRKIQQDYGQKPQATLFVPLLEGTDGVEKMSKSLGNYIGISELADVMYEKVMKIPDNMIIRYYELATDLHPDKIDDIKKQLKDGVNPRDIKMGLAREITGLYHSKADIIKAEEKFKTIFQQQKAPEDVQTLKFLMLNDNNLLNALITTLASSGKFESKSKIRKLLEQGAVKVNGFKINSLDGIPEIKNDDIIQVGKGNFFKIDSENNLKKKILNNKLGKSK